MLLKRPITGTYKLLGIIILGSALLHFLVIFFVPSGVMPKKHLAKAFKPKESSSISLELVEVSPPVQEGQSPSPQEELKKEDVSEEPQKKLQFVDTGGSPTDEEVKEETDKVGETGTLAKDTLPGGSGDLPGLEGTVEFPSLGGSGGDAKEQNNVPVEGAVAVAATEPSAEQDAEGEESQAEGNETKELSASASEEVKAPDDQQTPETDTTEPKLAEREAEEQKSEEPPKETNLAKLEKPNPPLVEELPKLTEKTEAPPTTTEPKDMPHLAEADKTAKEATSTEKTSLGEELSKLEIKEDGLIPLQKEEYHELAYVPPWELRSQARKSEKPKESSQSQATPKKQPKIAINFNAKTLTVGEIMPLTDTKEANAKGEGQAAFTVKKDEYAPYYRHIRDRISTYWFYKHGTKQEIKLETENNQPIVVEFKVYPEGVIGEVKIIQEAGNHLLAARIKDSVEDTRLERFSRFGVKEEYIDVRFNFYF